ncbi:MAG TPA: beta-ketoacyl-ACP synthase II [Dehalococcoidia bacterium]|nr:beta-ketoacyl-ACP synthase II [Dehalococcoidia bacterium]
MTQGYPSRPEHLPNRRVVVTGIGTVCPLGNNAHDTWCAMVEGRSGIRALTQFDTSAFEVRIGGEVRDFHPEESIPTKELRRMDRHAQFAVVAAQEAVADAGLRIDESNRDDVGVIFGSAGGGYGWLLEQNETYLKSGYRRVSPFLISNMLPDAASGHIAIATGACGPNMGIVSACSTGTGAIGEAWETVRRGDAEAVITGGADNALLPVLLAGFHALRALANDAEHPERACKPFDARRDGFVVSQGAAALVLESLEHAQARGATIHAEMIGYATTNDAYDMVAAHESGRSSALAMGRALRKAGIAPEDVGYINAHGTGTPLNDRVETAAIKTAFGEHAYKLAVSSTKSMHGHLMGGAGALEAIASVMALKTGMLPPTINYGEPDPACDLDYVPNVARQADVRVAVSNSVGLGGHNACVVLRRWGAGEE